MQVSWYCYFFRLKPNVSLQHSVHYCGPTTIQIRLEMLYSLIKHTKFTKSFSAINVSQLFRDMCQCNYTQAPKQSNVVNAPMFSELTVTQYIFVPKYIQAERKIQTVEHGFISILNLGVSQLRLQKLGTPERYYVEIYKPNFTQIRQETWALRLEIYVLEHECHCVD